MICVSVQPAQVGAAQEGNKGGEGFVMTERITSDLNLTHGATAISPGVAQGLTVEQLLYGVIVLAATAVRGGGLGAAPLTPDESAAAWSAWLAANAATLAGAPAPASALYYGVQSLIFWLFGSGDTLARLLPMLASVATVALPWFWRDWIGRYPALVLAAILALDPWLTAWGRRADATAIVILLALLVLTACWRWRAAASPGAAKRWERVGAVALAFLVAGGPWAWGMFPVLIFYVLIYRWPGRERPLARTTAIWFGAALALALTGFALRPEAVTALSASLTVWINDLSGQHTANPLSWPFMRLLLDQPLLAIFGPLGLLRLWRRSGPAGDRRLASFVSAWLAWGLLLWLLPGRPPAALPLVGLPLAIAAATLIGWALAQPWRDFTGLELATLVLVQTVLVIAGALWLAALVESVVLNQQIWLTSGVIVGLMAVVWVIFGVWAGWRATGQVAIIFYAVLLAALTLRSGWQLNHLSTVAATNGFWPAVTSPDLRLLVQDVERLSSARRGDPHQIDVQVVYDASPDPLLGWHLRAMRNLRHVGVADVSAAPASEPTPGSVSAAPLVIAPTLRNDGLALSDAYIGSDYATVTTWQPALLAPDTGQSDAQLRWTEFWRPRLQWLLYRKASPPPTSATVTLWAER